VYYFRTRAVNGSGVPSAYSNTVRVTTDGTLARPRNVGGIWLESAGGQIKIHWTPVTKRTDGSNLMNLAAYQIFTSNNLLTPRSQWAMATSVGTTQWATTPTPNVVTYYCLKAIDTNLIDSDFSQVVDDSADMNHFYIGSDDVTRVQVTQQAANVLLAANNQYHEDITIVPTEVVTEEVNSVVRSIDMNLVQDDSGNEARDIVFNPPVLHGTLHYNVVNGQVIQGSPSSLSTHAPVVSANEAATKLSLFWHNGVEWIKSSGQVNTADATLSFTSSHAGRFQIRAAARAAGIRSTRVYPRIITPNGDGWNDKVIFQFDNPEMLPLSGKIFDITGAAVANCTVGPNPDSSLAWDGKDSGGRVVPGGIYLYQIDLHGETLTGTVVVAR
jgi:hypothetical protein